jgi:hypothetical protein
MDWKRMLAYILGSVDEELLLRNEWSRTFYLRIIFRDRSRSVFIV